MISIRKATLQDAESIIQVHTKTWQKAFAGIILAETLEKLSENINTRYERLKQNFINEQSVQRIVAIENEKIIGFSYFGSCRNSDEINIQNAGEIYAIYVLPEHQNKQAGKRLVNFAVNVLQDEFHYDKIVIWTLKESLGREFYLHLDGKLLFHKIFEISGQSLEGIGFLFEDLEKLKKITFYKE
jgi:GNAT superfamily N-acetyltransferase